jgi:predicted transcriptional regulator of viral defense system
MEGQTGVRLGSAAASAFIRELAERQHGVVGRRQLTAAGLGKSLIQRRIEAGKLIRIHRGVYAVGHLRHDLRTRWMAAVLACGRAAVLSHHSAAHLWSMRGSYGPVEVTRASGGCRRRGIVIHQAHLRAPEVTVESGIPTTTIERTLLDLSVELDRRQIERALVAADRSGRLSWAALERVLNSSENREGASRLREVADGVDPRAIETRSPLEVDFLAMCRGAGLPTPLVNVLVGGHLVDFFWPAEGVIVETDSYTYHGDRPAFERDHQRTIALQLAGYKVLRCTAAMLGSDPASFLDLLRRTLAAQARATARRAPKSSSPPN